MRVLNVLSIALAAALSSVSAMSASKNWLQFGVYSYEENCRDLLQRSLIVLSKPGTLLGNLLEQNGESQKIYLVYGGSGPHDSNQLRNLGQLVEGNRGKLVISFNGASEFETGAPSIGKDIPSFYFAIHSVDFPKPMPNALPLDTGYSNMSPAYQRVLARLDWDSEHLGADESKSNIQVIEVRKDGAMIVSWLPISSLVATVAANPVVIKDPQAH